MMGRIKKRATSPAEFVRLLDAVSKAALIDAMWNACQLGTDESEGQITAKACRETLLALKYRGDALPMPMRVAARTPIDSDVDGETYEA